jgi:hypothetical protein
MQLAALGSPVLQPLSMTIAALATTVPDLPGL